MKWGEASSIFWYIYDTRTFKVASRMGSLWGFGRRAPSMFLRFDFDFDHSEKALLG